MHKILIVDDSVTDRELLKEILHTSHTNYEILLADSGRQALAAISEEHPDIILLDIQMKDMNGFEFMDSLSLDEDDFLPILLVSAFTNDDDRRKGLEKGATDFITKPIIPEEVKARVDVQVKFKKLFDKNNWVARKTNEAIKTLYKELETKNKELEKVDQLKSDFVSTVSHELRTPLGITTHGLSIILEGTAGELNEQQEKVLRKCEANLDRLENIIDDLLDISKIEEGRIELIMEELDLKALLSDLGESYQALLKKNNVTLSLLLPDDAVMVTADRDKIIQIMHNLLSNARKFTPEGGTVDLKLTGEQDEVVISVKDTGIGIAKEDLDKLFGKFQQFSRQHGPGIKGTGLGLSIVKSLVELHGGRVRADSELNKGTTIFVTLPVKQPGS